MVKEIEDTLLTTNRMAKKQITTVKRKSAYAYLKDFCPFAKDGRTIEITEWINQEGIDISIQKGRPLPTIIQFTYGELEAIKKLVKKLNDGN